MPGALETIGAIHHAGVNLAVVTHKPLIYAKQILEVTALRQFFLAVVGQSMVGRGRAKSDLIHEALRDLGVPRGIPVYVGDHAEDERAAKEVAIDFLPYGPDDWPTLKRRILLEEDGDN